MTAYFECDCGRKQPRARRRFDRGIYVAEAKAIGWTIVGSNWRCPFCSSTPKVDRTLVLRSIFNRSEKTK